MRTIILGALLSIAIVGSALAGPYDNYKMEDTPSQQLSLQAAQHDADAAHQFYDQLLGRAHANGNNGAPIANPQQ